MAEKERSKSIILGIILVALDRISLRFIAQGESTPLHGRMIGANRG
jgi:hypothetical protein